MRPERGGYGAIPGAAGFPRRKVTALVALAPMIPSALVQNPVADPAPLAAGNPTTCAVPGVIGARVTKALLPPQVTVTVQDW